MNDDGVQAAVQGLGRGAEIPVVRHDGRVAPLAGRIDPPAEVPGMVDSIRRRSIRGGLRWKRPTWKAPNGPDFGKAAATNAAGRRSRGVCGGIESDRHG